MSEENNPKNDLRSEFQTFGVNLKKVINSAWESEQKAKVQSEIEDGINELSKALNDFVSSVRASETGQKLKEEFDEFGDRVRSGEVEDKARAELMKVMKKLNTELEKAADNFKLKQE
jgi:hypothetical protein